MISGGKFHAVFKYRVILVIPLMVWLSETSLAQDWTLNAKVIDSISGEEMVSANIILDDSIYFVSDLQGQCQIQLSKNQCRLDISFVGYIPKSLDLKNESYQSIDTTISLVPTNILLNTATVTADRFFTPLRLTTVSVDIIANQLVKNTNNLSIEGVLDKVPGVNMLDGQANIRGGSGFSQGTGSRVLLLLNDLPILGADTGIPNWKDLPIEIIENIEVVKGSASALYGSSALNGIVHIKTMTATEEPQTEASLSYSFFGDPKDPIKKWWDKTPFESGVSLRHSRTLGKTGIVLGLFYSDFESYRKDWFEQRGRVNLFLNHELNNRIRFGVNTNLNLGRDGEYFFWAGLDSLNYRGLASSISTGNRSRISIDPYFTYFSSKGGVHRILGRYYRTDNENRTVDSDRSSLSSFHHLEYRYQKTWKPQEISLTYGIVWAGSKAEARLFGGESFSSLNLSGYLQIQKKLLDHLQLSVGLRHDRNQLNGPEIFEGQVLPNNGQTNENKTIWRIGANYQLGIASFLRASWGQGYRFPSVVEKYINTTNGGIPVSPNPSLNSEFGWSSEIALKQGFKVFDFHGFVDLSAFWSAYQEMIEFNFVDLGSIGFQSRNIGDTKIKGYEISVVGKGSFMKIPTRLLMGYTYIDPQFQDFDSTPIQPGVEPTEGQINANNSSVDYNILKYRNRHSFKFDVEGDVGKFTLGAACIYNSHIEAVDAVLEVLAVPGLREYRIENDNGYILYNIRLGFNVSNSIKVSALVNNIFNREYSVRPGLLDAPRSLSFRVDYVTN